MVKVPDILKNAKDVELRYATWPKQAIDLIAPRDMLLVGGRGFAKTTDFQADRSQEVIYDMPRAYSAFVADTYDNAMRNIVPSLFEGWTQRKGWREGVHFVVDDKPPASWDKPYKPPMTYKHTISMWNGHFFNIGSLAQPTSLAGNSYQHFFIDEAKNCKFTKLKKLFPALRGDYLEFGHSPYFLGMTASTDMPRVGDGEDDWILNYEKEMDKEAVMTALRAGIELNKIKWKLLKAKHSKNKARIKSLSNQYVIWYERWVRSRMDLVMFFSVSSFANADILRKSYFEKALSSLGIEEFKSAILSLKEELRAGEKFYVNLGEHHYYEDGLNIDFYKQFSLKEEVKQTSKALRYVQHDKPLECGIDFGTQISMVLGQPKGSYYYIFKNLYTLAPESSKELAYKFTELFKTHKNKVLYMYYDRSGNQYKELNRDWATEIKTAIEECDKDWRVKLMSEGQGNLFHEQEYNFAKKLFGEYVDGLPKVRIDKYQCRELKSSMELTKTKDRIKAGSKIIEKDKSSEKNLPKEKLPMQSTNFSDAFKYLVMRTRWMRIAAMKMQESIIDPGTY